MTAPYLPSIGWCRSLLLASAEKGVDPISEKQPLPETVKRDIARAVLLDADLRQLIISVPVAGGASALKNRQPPEELLISEHGNWRHTHLGAINAIYGRAPFFPHLMPELEKVYRKPFLRLGEFNFAILHTLFTFLLNQTPGEAVAELMLAPPGVARRRGTELWTGLFPGLSVIHPLMHYGPESLFILCSPAPASALCPGSPG